MRQVHLRIVLFRFLKVLTLDHNVGMGKMPPFGKSLGVIEPRVDRSFLFLIVALKLAVVVDGLEDLQSLALNEKVVPVRRRWVVHDIFPRARTALILHPVPIRAFLFVGVVRQTPITVKPDR